MRSRMIALKMTMLLAMMTLLDVLGLPGSSARPSARPSVRRLDASQRASRATIIDDGELHHTHPERGDVPGWVLVTLMTAGLVIAIWAVAGPALINVFNTALTRILSI